MRRRCYYCRKLTYKWQSFNGSSYHCYDGCYETTGRDWRTEDGTPLWEGGKVRNEKFLGAAGLLNKY